jgi:hypothetical protein
MIHTTENCCSNIISHGNLMVVTINIFQQCMCVSRDILYLIVKKRNEISLLLRTGDNYSWIEIGWHGI